MENKQLEPVDKQVVSIKIFDVNEFYMIKIFEYLDIESLFNVANANGRLRPAAVDVYQRNFRQKSVQLSLNIAYPSVAGICDTIMIFGFKSFLPYLRCFSTSMENLEIYYYGSQNQRLCYLHQYINVLCGKFNSYQIPSTV